VVDRLLSQQAAMPRCRSGTGLRPDGTGDASAGFLTPRPSRSTLPSP